MLARSMRGLWRAGGGPRSGRFSGVSRESSNRSSATRKRALRRLASEQNVDYAALYYEIRPTARSRFSARGQAWTRLRRLHEERYLDLYALELAGHRITVSAKIRTTAWQQACSRMSDLYKSEYRELLRQHREAGLSDSQAYNRAWASLREAHAEMFATLLAHEYEILLAAE